MAAHNDTPWSVRVTLICLWMWIQECGCDTQTGEGEFSGVSVSALKRFARRHCQEVFQEKIEPTAFSSSEKQRVLFRLE